MANSRARSGSVLVGGIFPPWLLQISKPLAQFLTPQAEQWANDAARHRIDSRQARQTGAAQQMRQNRFGLIVRGVSDSDTVKAAGLGHGRKKLVTQAARGILEIPAAASRFARDVGATGFQFKLELRGQSFHEALVFVRFCSAQLMVEMQNDERDSELSAQVRKNPEQRDGIRPSRHTNTHAVAWSNHGVPRDGFADPFVDFFVHLTECQRFMRLRMVTTPARVTQSREGSLGEL